jgi:predicted HD phosphohydrolase
MPSDILERIEHWFALHGATSYEGARRESVSALNHALQCAQLAEHARAEAPLIVAALLHDVGHFVAIADVGEMEDIDDVHELRGVAVLVRDFTAAVVEPIRLHVAAKRYLTATEPKYLASFRGIAICRGRGAAQAMGRPGEDAGAGDAEPGVLPGVGE